MDCPNCGHRIQIKIQPGEFIVPQSAIKKMAGDILREIDKAKGEPGE